MSDPALYHTAQGGVSYSRNVSITDAIGYVTGPDFRDILDWMDVV